jgi:integrase
MTMKDQVNAAPASQRRVPWNMSKLTGAKPPLRPKHVWSIRTKLQIEGRARDLAMFNLAIDSKLPGCDVVAIRVEDVAAGGYTADCATVRQKKTGRPVRFELSEQTRQAVDDYLKPTAQLDVHSCDLPTACLSFLFLYNQTGPTINLWTIRKSIDPKPSSEAQIFMPSA